MPRPKYLFIVDDDEDDQLFLKEAVKDLQVPVQCYCTNDGETALSQLKNNNIPFPDFIFLDLNMPKLNGKECLAEIKKMPQYSEVPIIIYSTSSYPKDIQEIMQLGASYFFTKPTRISELCQKLNDILSTDWKNSELADELRKSL